MSTATKASASTAGRAKRRTRRKGLSDEELRERFPLLKKLAGPPGTKEGADAWEAAFEVQPNAMAQILGDIIKQAYAKPGRVGQRPMPREEDVDFHALVYGDYTDEPLIEVLPKLIKVSQRAFAMKLRMSRSQLQRLLDGSLAPDTEILRRIADAVGKDATYFVEYRKLMAITAFASLIDERPGIATKLYREYLAVTAE